MAQPTFNVRQLPSGLWRAVPTGEAAERFWWINVTAHSQMECVEALDHALQSAFWTHGYPNPMSSYMICFRADSPIDEETNSALYEHP